MNFATWLAWTVVSTSAVLHILSVNVLGTLDLLRLVLPQEMKSDKWWRDDLS
ncbi:MAG: hypothetical protein WBD13_07655 [Burkholderiaceae bacterium]